jgi:hypothetical protein
MNWIFLDDMLLGFAPPVLAIVPAGILLLVFFVWANPRKNQIYPLGYDPKTRHAAHFHGGNRFPS